MVRRRQLMLKSLLARQASWRDEAASCGEPGVSEDAALRLGKMLCSARAVCGGGSRVDHILRVTVNPPAELSRTQLPCVWTSVTASSLVPRKPRDSAPKAAPAGT